MRIASEWYEDDRFWELAEPIMFDDVRHYLALPDVNQVIQLAGCRPGAAVLDLCCGPGRHSIELARKGYRVTGVDRTRKYLDRARKAAGPLEIEWIEEDARRFVRPNAFDLAINLYTSFGYFDSQEDDRLVAANLAESLAPGGVLVIQTQGKELVAKSFNDRTWGEAGEITWLQEQSLQAGFAAIETRWTLIGPSWREEIGFVVRLYAATEMAALLKAAGFSEVRFLGSLDGLPYDHTAGRMIVVAHK